VVQEAYLRLIEKHGPPLVLKSDNGGPFRDDGTKQLLAEHRVIPLYNPRRRPAYNGGVERANGQLASYQEAVAAAHGREGLPKCADAEEARQLANDLARPTGWRGPTARELWQQRPPIAAAERADFQAAVEEQRHVARSELNLPLTTPLGHYPAAAVDRRAVRKALVSGGLLRILPRRRARASSVEKQILLARGNRAVILDVRSVMSAPQTGAPGDPAVQRAPLGTNPKERAHCSTHKSAASGQH
jgi:hypothetical protein